MKSAKVLCCMFLFAFLTLTLHKTQDRCLLLTEELTKRNFWLRKYIREVQIESSSFLTVHILIHFNEHLFNIFIIVNVSF